MNEVHSDRILDTAGSVDVTAPTVLRHDLYRSQRTDLFAMDGLLASRGQATRTGCGR